MGFPSPCGEKVGINTVPFTQEFLGIHGVSVPLRGKGRDQPRKAVQRLREQIATVSVPLRGKGRDQLQQGSR